MANPRSNPFPITFIVLYGLLAIACIVLIVIGAMRAYETVGIACLASGLLGLIVTGATLPITLLMHRLRAGQGGADGAAAQATAMRAMPSSTTIEQLLSRIHENSMLSDNAKRVLFRDQELNLLRRAIEEDIANGDYSSGLTLCDEMANLFGHREEAEAYRQRIHQANHAAYESQVQHALAQFDSLLRTRDWAAAHREAASIRRLFPAHHLVQDLELRIMAAREEHKRELEGMFLEAANRDDVATAMTLLKELDKYLTRDEAGRLSEIAQSVVIKHRDGLSVQFKRAVSEHRWAEAARLGDVIIAEYPNTKMADEVRSMIDVLRVRATQAAVLAES